MVDIICYCKGNKRFGSLGCSVLHLRDLRLITLQGVIHKVLAQVLARRLNYGESRQQSLRTYKRCQIKIY